MGYEGERKMVKDNNKLGDFILSGFPKGPAGISHEVTFDVDANGIMKVSAKITQSGKENSMTITKDKQRLTSEQIEEMIKDADLYAEEDAKAEAAAKQKGEVDKFTKDTDYKLGKARSKMSEDEIKTVEDKVAEARKLADYKGPEGEERQIPDESAKKPDDWSDDDDGEWEPPMIPNPNFKDVTSLLNAIKADVDPILNKYPVEAEKSEDDEDDAEESIEEDPDFETEELESEEDEKPSEEL